MFEDVIKMKIFTYNQIEYLHIADFAKTIGRSIQSTRYLIEKGNRHRKLKATRDGSRLLIPLVELKGYPFSAAGRSLSEVGEDVYHYVQGEDGEWKKVLCEQCTFSTEKCDAARIADEAIIPQGDA